MTIYSGMILLQPVGMNPQAFSYIVPKQISDKNMRELLKKYLWDNRKFTQKVVPTMCFLAAAFLLGKGMAGAVQENRQSQNAYTQVNARGEVRTSDNAQFTTNIRVISDTPANETAGGIEESQTWVLLFTENWGLGFGDSGKRPTGNSSAEELAKYNAYYVCDSDEKKIYLTFDCGYENGNTEAILDALKKHNAPATFFVVGHYLESAPDLVKRMVAEGHTVGNHTYHHPDMSKISDAAAFQKEMDDVRSLYKEVVGEEMPMYYRPPQGKYSESNLQMAKDLGYSTFFWSLAYVDWNVDNQPSHEEAFKKLTKRIHPGAVVLLHNTSKTNGEILDELLGKWEEMGYTFGSLEELIALNGMEQNDTQQNGIQQNGTKQNNTQQNGSGQSTTKLSVGRNN